MNKEKNIDDLEKTPEPNIPVILFDKFISTDISKDAIEPTTD